MSALVLECKENEKFRLRDTETGTVTEIKVFYRNGDRGLAVRFEAPQNIRIDRIRN